MKEKATREESEFWNMLNLLAAGSPAAILFLTIRVCMAMAFYIFQTIWTVSLMLRFNFVPSDHGKFVSFIGFTYSLSQGFVAKFLLSKFGGNAPRDRVREGRAHQLRGTWGWALCRLSYLLAMVAIIAIGVESS
jgi:hypothetical protein